MMNEVFQLACQIYLEYYVSYIFRKIKGWQILQVNIAAPT